MRNAAEADKSGDQAPAVIADGWCGPPLTPRAGAWRAANGARRPPVGVGRRATAGTGLPTPYSSLVFLLENDLVQGAALRRGPAAPRRVAQRDQSHRQGVVGQ